MEATTPTRVCRKCKHEWPISEFGKNKNKPDGLQPICKRCINTPKPHIPKQTCAQCHKVKKLEYFPLDPRFPGMRQKTCCFCRTAAEALESKEHTDTCLLDSQDALQRGQAIEKMFSHLILNQHHPVKKILPVLCDIVNECCPDPTERRELVTTEKGFLLQ